MDTNIKPNKAKSFSSSVAGLFRVLGQSSRLQILQAIGSGEACVCHLEAALLMRQAKISQHLMALRKAGVVTARREGRNIFYRLSNPDLIALLRQAGRIGGVSENTIHFADEDNYLSSCFCPHCTGELVEDASGTALFEWET